MCIFLTGNSGIGKSRILMRALMPYMAAVSGFVVQRLTENGRVIGFRAVSLEDGYPPYTAGYIPGQDGIFILRGKYYISPLEEVILRVERESLEPRRKLLLLDEIGGVDLASRLFTDAVGRILSGKKFCAGVLKSRDNLARMSQNLHLAREFDVSHRSLETRIRGCGEILTVSEDTIADTGGYLSSRISQVLEHSGENE